MYITAEQVDEQKCKNNEEPPDDKMEDGESNMEEEVVVGEMTKVGLTQEKEVHKTGVDDKSKHSKNSPQQQEHQNKQPSMMRRKLQK